MIAVLVICIIIIISVGVATMIASIINEEIINFIFGLVLSIFGVIGFLGFEELVNNDNTYTNQKRYTNNQTNHPTTPTFLKSTTSPLTILI